MAMVPFEFDSVLIKIIHSPHFQHHHHHNPP